MSKTRGMLPFLHAIVCEHPQYQSRVPNGYVNGQATGHAGDNPFRWAFRDAGYKWTVALCEADTDGDGQSNGHELGDPCCHWTEGATPDFVLDVSIPGDYNSRTWRSPCAEPSPSDVCVETHDFILVGSGAGGSAAAAFLREHNASFAWYEAGGDESDRMRTHSAVDPMSLPTHMWSPTKLQTTTGRSLAYQIPLGTGGMTSHYVGVSYWTLRDTRASLQMLPHETEALQFVINRTLATNVYCDEYDARFHTHNRSSEMPAPDVEISSLPMCMYGRCNGTKCHLNDYMASTSLGISPLEQNWYRQSSFMEYGGEGIRLNHRVVSIERSGARVTGVRVKNASGDVFLSCASNSVLLGAGVMGNAHILPSPSYPFFAQPVVVHVDNAIAIRQDVCDEGSVSGGTLHHPRFLSVFSICTVNGVPRLVFASPQAINEHIHGTVFRDANGSHVATVNFDDPQLYETLWSDLEYVASSLWGVTLTRPSDQRVQYAAYHWTGDAHVVHRSRHREYDNLFLADAMAVVGTTSGWTSFNARVAGALAALRAMQEGNVYSCTHNYATFHSHCCNHTSDDVCTEMRREYQSRACCVR